MRQTVEPESRIATVFFLRESILIPSGFFGVLTSKPFKATLKEVTLRDLVDSGSRGRVASSP
jgi:hypothetical protein